MLVELMSETERLARALSLPASPAVWARRGPKPRGSVGLPSHPILPVTPQPPGPGSSPALLPTAGAGVPPGGGGGGPAEAAAGEGDDGGKAEEIRGGPAALGRPERQAEQGRCPCAPRGPGGWAQRWACGPRSAPGWGCHGASLAAWTVSPSLPLPPSVTLSLKQAPIVYLLCVITIAAP